MSRPHHILVIRLSAMGDVAMTLPVLRVLLQTYPDLKITLLSRPQFKPIFAGLDRLEFMEADVYGQHQGFFGLLKLAKQIQSLQVDAVADLHSVIRSKVLTTMLRLQGVPSESINKGRAEKKKLTRAKGMGLVQLKSTHQRYADVFKVLGYPLDLNLHRFPERQRLNPRLQTLLGNEPKKCIGIAPFAAYDSKCYPLHLMEAVMELLEKDESYRLLLFGGGQKETEQLEEMALKFNSASSIAGKLTFGEELNLISNLDLMLSMDSANGHLAANFGIPVITLWGVTHPYAGFAPFMQPMENQLMADRNQYPLIPTSVYGNKFPEGYEDVMQTIAPEKVVDRIKNLFNHTSS